MKLKNWFLLTFVVTLTFMTLLSCQREGVFDGELKKTKQKLFSLSDNQLPKYTYDEFIKIVKDKNSEDALDEKIAIFSYFLCSSFSQTGSANFTETMNGAPCDDLLDPIGGYQALKPWIGNSNINDAWNLFFKSLILDFRPDGPNYTLTDFKSTLQFRNEGYSLYASKPNEMVSNTSKGYLFLYGRYSLYDEEKIAGFYFEPDSRSIQHLFDYPATILSNTPHVLIKSVFDSSPEAMNDPCHYSYVYNSGGNTNQDPGTGMLDEDGVFKKRTTDGIISPIACSTSVYTGNKTGVRLVAFSLGERFEGQICGGRSEVYLYASAWNSNDIPNTMVSNSGGEPSGRNIVVPSTNTIVSYKKPLWIADVKKSSIGQPVPHVIPRPFPNHPGYPDTNDDWVILKNGFSEDGYDNLWITIFERDKCEEKIIPYPLNLSHNVSLDNHFLRETMKDDYWIDTGDQNFLNQAGGVNPLTPWTIAFYSNCGINCYEFYLVRDVNGHMSMQFNYQPYVNGSGQTNAGDSWFKFELY